MVSEVGVVQGQPVERRGSSFSPWFLVSMLQMPKHRTEVTPPQMQVNSQRLAVLRNLPPAPTHPRAQTPLMLLLRTSLGLPPGTQNLSPLQPWERPSEGKEPGGGGPVGTHRGSHS